MRDHRNHLGDRWIDLTFRSLLQVRIGQPVRQDIGDFLGRLIAIIRLLGHHLFDDGLQRKWHVRTNRSNRRRLQGLMRNQTLSQRAGIEWGMPSQEVIQRTPEAVDVGPGIDLVAVESLFG